MLILSVVSSILARVSLIVLFLPFCALDKILNFKAAVGQASEAIPSRGLA
jgi:putative oxidoreductase